ncbi:8-oxo-dGTP diphosphatase [Pseudomonas hunanensis]|uniref:8-oxo-dGTP diphosphatase n=1 Tax=Pseudomonas hunanensis TaxID=1247546 RepID=A0ACC6K268_9PSED|nr:NUDIX domain-containing protein [Pseudomonas hunanensis]MDR6712525.1 8-oxo-dGTP diphosphatase [Pseudomonas hunanensis]
MADQGMLRSRATVLCFRNGKLLLVRRKSQKWNFPGGGVKLDELPIHAATRELEEETGICRERLLPLCTLYVEGILHHIFTLQIDDHDRPVPQNEIVACKWIMRGKLAHSDLKPAAAALLARELPALCA